MERKPSSWYHLICPHMLFSTSRMLTAVPWEWRTVKIKPETQVGSNYLEILASSWSKVEQSPTKHFNFSVNFSAPVEPDTECTVLLKEFKHLAINQHVTVSIKVRTWHGRVDDRFRQAAATVSLQMQTLGFVAERIWEFCMLQGDRVDCSVLPWSIHGWEGCGWRNGWHRRGCRSAKWRWNPNSAKVIKGEITAALSAEEYSCCISCKAKVQPLSATIGECPKYNAKIKNC